MSSRASRRAGGAGVAGPWNRRREIDPAQLSEAAGGCTHGGAGFKNWAIGGGRFWREGGGKTKPGGWMMEEHSLIGALCLRFAD